MNDRTKRTTIWDRFNWAKRIKSFFHRMASSSLHEIKSDFSGLNNQITALNARLAGLESKFSGINHKSAELLEVAKKISEAYAPDHARELAKLQTEVLDLKKRVLSISKVSDEILWSNIFNSTIVSSNWLQDHSFSPGRGAVGYPFLYVMYRVLDEFRPTCILEFGIGQSTRMITRYSTAFSVDHLVVESDINWINKFSEITAMSPKSSVIHLETELRNFKDAENVLMFIGLEETLGGNKFDFICIDAPLGVNMKQFSRVDILKMLPDCLSETFVIMLDDTERPGERNTCELISQVLNENNIGFVTKKYHGQKDFTLWSSSNLNYLTCL